MAIKVLPFVSISDWIDTEDKWLSEDESLHNAQLVANHFSGKWTPNAIAALCGNMRHESSINPNVWEYGYNHDPSRGYGLVQWTPATKYINWANSIALPWQHGDSQLARIDYEQKEGIQWIPIVTYDYMSFNEFTQSTLSVNFLTEVFTWCYERPRRDAGEDSMPARQAFAVKVLELIEFGGSPNPNPKPVEGLTLNRHSTNMRRMGVRGRR